VVLLFKDKDKVDTMATGIEAVVVIFIACAVMAAILHIVNPKILGHWIILAWFGEIFGVLFLMFGFFYLFGYCLKRIYSFLKQ
jgi:hypothetical protein